MRRNLKHIKDHMEDNVYLNIVINNTSNQGNAPTIARYESTKTEPILEKSSDYYCAVLRFTLPLESVPLFIMPVIPNSGLTNTTPLIIGVNDGIADISTNLIYVPDNNLPQPNQNDPNKQITSDYYYVYSYKVLIDMINTALNTVIAASTIVVTENPYFYYDPVTQLISLYVENVFTTGAASPVIYMNEQLQHYLDAFRFRFQGYNQPNGKDYIMNLSNPANNTGYVYPAGTPTNPPTYFIFTQEYSVIQYWNSLRKIFFTSNSIPITKEFEPGFSLINYNQNNVASSQPIITDFVPPLETAGQSRAIAYFVPSSQYRLIDMQNDGPLYKIDIAVYWQDKDGNQYPLTIGVFHQIEIKLGFFRKELYKGSQLLT